MRSFLDEPKREIEARCIDGRRKVMAWVSGPLAVHQEIIADGLFGLAYSITHVPSGISMGPTFASEYIAAAALDEIAAVCDWANFRPSQVDLTFRKRMKDIIQKWGGESSNDPERDIRARLAITEFNNDLNGYAPTESE